MASKKQTYPDITINQDRRSPNFDERSIPVEFVVIHYSAGGLQTVLEHFSKVESQVSSHLIISEQGEVHEMVACWDGTTHRAWHAGKSRFQDGGKLWEGFNDFSIGIELINFNGNVFTFPPAQYQALIAVLQHLKSLYPALSSPSRIIGHEQIAGYRGKADPGLLFDWQQVYHNCYPEKSAPPRTAVCPPWLQKSLMALCDAAPAELKRDEKFWFALSSFLEAAVAALQKLE